MGNGDTRGPEFLISPLSLSFSRFLALFPTEGTSAEDGGFWFWMANTWEWGRKRRANAPPPGYRFECEIPREHPLDVFLEIRIHVDLSRLRYSV